MINIPILMIPIIDKYNSRANDFMMKDPSDTEQCLTGQMKHPVNFRTKMWGFLYYL